MAERAGGRSSVPQIFIGDHHVGGCDDLYALHRAGKLDALVEGRIGDDMIRYSLVCENGHQFDSWFPGSAAFDEQARRGLVECPMCRSLKVRKSIMAPRLAKGASGRRAELRTIAGAGEPQSPAPVVMDERLAALRTMIREMRATIARHTTDVGSAFSDEARKMHAGEIEHRPIRGEATPDGGARTDRGRRADPADPDASGRTELSVRPAFSTQTIPPDGRRPVRGRNSIGWRAQTRCKVSRTAAFASSSDS